MAGAILDLEPKRFWYHFNEICKIPHCSYNEAGVRNYIIKVAEENGCEYKVDDGGNLVVRKPATSAELTNPIVLQGHLDMVCESEPGLNIDFSKEPIKPLVDGEWVTADGTSLGADNGVAVAASLAVLESKDMKHGPLECLYTTAEETGLEGAMKLDPDLVKGRTMLNLDTEEDWILYIGCAGGEFPRLNIPFARKDVPEGFTGLELKVAGLQGGHSGLMIQLQRGNANKIAARILREIRNDYDLYLSSFNGGSKHNVIPPDATATFAVKNDDVQNVKKLIDDIATKVKAELKNADPECKVEVTAAQVADVIDQKDSDKIINFVNAAPHGVLKMSHDIEGLVETSFNFAVIRTEKDHCFIETSLRSSTASEMERVRNELASLAELTGLKLEKPQGYPGWQPNLDSRILNITKKSYKDMFGKEPEVTAVHAGLECGVVGEKYPGMDMISMGPWMEKVHSPAERVNIESCQKFWKFLVKMLEEASRA